MEIYSLPCTITWDFWICPDLQLTWMLVWTWSRLVRTASLSLAGSIPSKSIPFRQLASSVLAQSTDSPVLILGQCPGPLCQSQHCLKRMLSTTICSGQCFDLGPGGTRSGFWSVLPLMVSTFLHIVAIANKCQFFAITTSKFSFNN